MTVWIAFTDREPFGMDFPIWMGGDGWVIPIADANAYQDHHKARKWATHWMPMEPPNPPPR